MHPGYSLSAFCLAGLKLSHNFHSKLLLFHFSPFSPSPNGLARCILEFDESNQQQQQQQNYATLKLTFALSCNFTIAVLNNYNISNENIRLDKNGPYNWRKSSRHR
ncbi:hypothetical protein Tsp_01359 [Trichinella spiralis]|uniref:hypothetical protein n=1 Tax=Trichinella spiralis TaxID=6334 RepID=UPI0001EFD06D|nr:hypothetical protein Tsp_01359 [Trichinella spiralis]